MGRNILGDAERLRTFCSSDLHAFVNRCYAPDHALLFVMGKVTERDVLRCLKMKRTDPSSLIPHSPSPISHPSSLTPHPSTFTLQKDTHQAHVMVGARAYAMTDARFMGLQLLSNLLGGPAMNSRLSLALRERTGLVYTVESAVTGYTDTGVWSVYFGCDHDDVQRCLRLVRRELQRLIERPLTQRTLDAARRQMKGQIGVSYNNSENVALAMAKRYLHTGHTMTREEIYAELDALTPLHLHAIAREIFDTDHLTTLIYQ